MTADSRSAIASLNNDLPTLQQPIYSSLAVAILQQILIIEGYGTLPDGSTLPITGNFLNETNIAVLNFQQAMGLVQDGVVGPSTWAALTQV